MIRIGVLAGLAFLTALTLLAFDNTPATRAGENGFDNCLGCPDQSFPPAGTDEMGLTGLITIDLSPIEGPTETVEIVGDTIVERGEPKVGANGSSIPIEIVELELTGTSSLLGDDTPVTLQLNENDGSGMGQIQDQNPDPLIDFPASGARQLPFLDLQIGPLPHFLNGPLNLQSNNIVRIPYLGSHWESGPIDLQIIDSSQPSRVVGFVKEVVLWYDDVFSITVLKLNDTTNGPISDWGMALFANGDCSGDPIDVKFTDENGIVDFRGLPEGVYSVEEEDAPDFQPTDGNLCREDIELPGPSDTAGVDGEFVDCPVENLPFPEPGCDSFNSGAQVNVQLASGGEPFTITLDGPTTVHRKTAPQDEDAFPSGDAQPSGGGNGRDEVQTEIIQLDLAGKTSMFGTITVEQSPDQPSEGMFEEQSNENPGEMDFPADSFFDIFVHIHIPGAGVGTLYNADPIRMECVIFGIPPFFCLYQPPIDDPIELYRLDNDELFAFLVHAAHVPIPPDEVFIVFRNVPGKALIQGDFDCDGDADAVDGLVVLTFLAGLTPNQQEGCTLLDTLVTIGLISLLFGDVDCDGDIDAVDALKLLQFVAGLPFDQNDPCPTVLDP